MKSLKSILEASILADIDDQLEYGDKEVLKIVIIKWLKDNVNSIDENKLKFDFNTTPMTVNYDGDIHFKKHITSLTSETFQWSVIGGNFNCSFCKSLKSLEDAPKEVGGDFNCSCCKLLTSLKGAPERVGGYFDCSNCDSLKSLKGAPKEVRKYFDCSFCESLKSLDGAPKSIEGWFGCTECGENFTEDYVKKVSKVKGKIYC